MSAEGGKIETRLAKLGQQLAERERPHADALNSLWSCARALHARVASALEPYHEAIRPSAPHLAVSLSEPRVDDKHAHAVEFELARGRHRAVVTVKRKGEITLVGPFRAGKAEGPCRSFPISAASEIEGALGDFLCAFIDEAAAP